MRQPLSFRSTPESSHIKYLDPGVRRGDDLFGVSLALDPFALSLSKGNDRFPTPDTEAHDE
jgi:hypothetical protein